MNRLIALCSVLVAASGLAFWAPNHQDLNVQVLKEGKPWGAVIVRSGRPISGFDDYLQRVLYVSAEPPRTQDIALDTERSTEQCVGDRKDLVMGVPFQPARSGQVIGNDSPTDQPTLRLPLYCWVVKGGFWEDGFEGMDDGAKWGGRRAVNHFHDPLAPGGGGYTGLLEENAFESTPILNLARRGISATQWVMNGQSGGADGKNEWGYPTVGVGLHRAFSETELIKRESGMASAFRAMGQMMHLIADNTVPDHARDLAHPGEGFEEWLRDDAQFKHLFGHTPVDSWVIFPVRTLAAAGIRAFWDRDVYSTSPATTLGGVTPGIAEFTNANFLAWSHLKKGPGGIDIDFSTVPKDPGEGFKRSPRFGGLDPRVPFPLLRSDNLVEYPWPRLDAQQGNLFPSAPGSLSLPAVAVFDSSWSDGFSGPNVINGEAWKHYARPLMERAHGYAQSVLSLGLQPARAEVVPAVSGDVMRLTLRLWNLWPSSSPHALTWFVDSLELVSIKPDDVIVPNGSRVQLLTTPLEEVAPGGVLQITGSMSIAEYATLALSSHTALLVTAHLLNDERTPLKFAVPIPNGYPLVKQLQTIDQTSLYIPPAEDCCTSSTCGQCGAQQAFRNPISQLLTGEIEVVPTERDIFMKKAPKEVKEAMKRDARVSGVALLAYNQPNATFAAPTRTMNATSLIVQNSNLERVNNGFWLRPQDAPDDADDTLRFTVSLNPRDFYVAATSPLVDGARATGTLYLAVWMSSGALYLQRLIFWPMGPNQPVEQVVGAEQTCSLSSAVRFELPEERTSVCTSSQTSSIPCMGNETVKRLSISTADSGLSRVQWAVSESLTIQSMLSFGTVRATRFGDIDLPPTADKLFAAPCTEAQLLFFPTGNGRVACNGWGAGLGYFNLENPAPTPGLCAQVPPPLPVPRTIDYVRVFAQEPELFTRVFGRETMVMPPTFQLTSL